MTVPVPVVPPTLVAASTAGDLKINQPQPINNNNNPSTEPHHPLHDNEAGFKDDAFLDTTNDTQEAGSFEGPEKLLEIWFGPAPYLLQGIRTIPEAVQQAYPGMVPFEFDEATDRYGLCIVPKTVWDTMLDIVKCKVLNQIQNDCMDAYLLSESSFFVYPHKLILKTCGTTTLLMALPKILEIAQKFCGLEKVWRVFYSRKTFMFPDRQLHVHRSWKDEVEFLDRHFEHGAAYTVGKVNGDHWCLYLTAPQDDCLSHITSRHNSVDSEDNKAAADAAAAALAEAQAASAAASAAEANAIAQVQALSIQTDRRGSVTHYDDSPIESPSGSSATSPSLASSSSSFSMSSTASSSTSYLYPSHDQTVEILMTNLNPEAMKRFYQQPTDVPGTEGGVRVDQDTGLANLFPQAQLDSYLFTPCGYSANALQDGYYYTIHVTPEPVCSYASFETNIPVRLGKKKRSSSSSSSRRSSGRSTPQNQQSGNVSTSEEGEMLTDDDKREKDEKEGAYHAGPETLTELISRVVEIFQPGTMSVTLFSSHMNEDGSLETERQAERRQRHMVKAMGRIKGFTRTDRILYEFDGCDLVFGHFEVSKA
ncbi:spermidine resistance protein [Actinomortierella wolfii]|nr:spermidine resistance protein [Actinomortierella wolfii]